ncbi:breast cancer type 1 susceptibility protein homolog [Papilio machaon]|uniref:breast cancer type 1 susceptibility protein homolog n=1 Tax=Papilio machaon TaxID=76193 RepID=UPI001E665A95|nr:breast cancer type 1 susceptibility protein homolog [Papilio machaon]
MILKDFNINLLTKLLTQQLEQVTCFGCCRCYCAPVTAECGHTLCNGCWYGRANCPVCALPVEKKNQKLNLPLQLLTDHVYALVNSFEKLFNIKLAELELETTNKELQITDTNKNVTDWLENSQNKFSAAISNLSTQDLNTHVEYLTSKAQIHTANSKPTHQPKKDSIQHLQDDWDKIEILEDPKECVQDKENIHIETMDIEVNEYTSENPRRSTRKKEISISRESHDIHNEKADSTKSNTAVSKQATKTKQTWNHAKKMRQEFSRLNKENTNKLNVSIETVKKTQVSCSTTKLVEKQNLTTTATRNITANESSKETVEEKSLATTNIVNPGTIISSNTKKGIDKTNEYDSTNQTPSNIRNKNNTSIDSGNPCDNEEVISPKVKFFKKGPLHVKPQEMPHTSHDKDETKISDDVIITIRVGKVITNVCIKQNESNPQIKIHTDKEVQTTLEPENNTCNNIKINTVKSTQLNSINQKQPKTLSIMNVAKQSHKEIVKSDSTKKNTASADTRTAQFEITASSEKELPHIMECFADENRQKTIQSQKGHKDNDQGTRKENIPEDIEGINDIFDCEFSKTPSVQSLKATKNVPSAILVPTQNKSKTYSPVDKRLRSLDYEELPLKKKQRLDTKNVTMRGSKVGYNDSECSNYDTVMEKVFANIDADIGIIQSKTTDNILSNKANSTKNTQVVYSQSKNYDHNKNGDSNNQKDSENLFSNFDNDVITQTNKLNTQTKPIRNESLTPNLCQEFTSPEEDNRENEKMDIELGTPLNDDSDVSIVEETPQKNVSNIKVKQKSGISSNFDNDISEQSDAKNLNLKATIKNNISSNSLNETIKKNQEYTDIKKVKNSIITPSTINKFVEQIQHKSTPVARKSLNFNIKNIKQDAEETLCKSLLTEVETTQEKEFMNEVFQEAVSSPEFKSSVVLRQKNRKIEFCVAGSCLIPKQTIKLRQLCRDKGWRFVEEYTDDVTHLVIEVDEENKCKRSLKYMRALAAGKWIIGFAWVEKCIQTGTIIPEEGFECLDMTGEPGPRRSRLARRKLFSDISFYCMPPINMLDHHMLKEILVSAGGTLVHEMSEVRVADGAPGLVLAEPEHTQDSKYEYLAMDLGIVPVHCEWALNCLGHYALAPLEVPLLLCSPTVLKPKVQHWPHELRALIE